MVIIDGKLCVKAGLLGGTVVFGIEFTIRKNGRREVGGEREGELVVKV